MNEFENQSKENLKILKIALEAYLRGIEDTFSIIKDLHERSVQLYQQKILDCEKEINKELK